MVRLQASRLFALVTAFPRAAAGFRGTTHTRCRRSLPPQRRGSHTRHPRGLAAQGGDSIRGGEDRDEARQQQQERYPRAAVAVALRCLCHPEPANDNDNGGGAGSEALLPRYLLIQRGTEPNKGRWALPGGKLEWGEPTLEGARRELGEETVFLDGSVGSGGGDHRWEMEWSPNPFATTDSIVGDRFHYLIALCFAELRPVGACDAGASGRLRLPPRVAAADDAKDARWWSLDELVALEKEEGGNSSTTPGFVERMKRTEDLYQRGVLLPAD